MAQFDQMNNQIQQLQKQVLENEEDIRIFVALFKMGHLKTDRNGNVTAVTDTNHQLRIAQGWNLSLQGDNSQKTQE